VQAESDDIAYHHRTLSNTSELLKEIENEARRRFMTVMLKDSFDVLIDTVKTKQPKRILELGTAVGYSGIAMLNASPNARLYTVEYLEERAKEAHENFIKAGVDKRVEQFIASADEVLDNLSGEFDFMFIDAAKSHYEHYFDMLDKHLEHGGVMVFDNVLFRGYVEGKAEYKHRMNTIVTNMRKFIERLKNNENYVTTVLDVGDGLLIAEKK